MKGSRNKIFPLRLLWYANFGLFLSTLLHIHHFAFDDELDFANVKIGTYVLVEYSGKKTKSYYVGKVVSAQDNGYEIDFFRKCPKGNKFVKPNAEDVATVDKDQVKAVMPKPLDVGTTRRTKDSLVFNVGFEGLNIR